MKYHMWWVRWDIPRWSVIPETLDELVDEIHNGSLFVGVNPTKELSSSEVEELMSILM